MAISTRPAPGRGVARDHGFHPLTVRRIVRETADAVSVVLDVPTGLRDLFHYEAGQFLTFRVSINGQSQLRSYSMSSSPHVGDELQVTVKRVPGGIVSSWIADVLAPGDVIESTCPAGVFCLAEGTGDVVTFAGGSGITPVFSLLKTVLASTERRAHLLYANRDADAVIFAEALDALAARHPGRLLITHHLDDRDGFPGRQTIDPYATAGAEAEHYICGPAPFMDLVEQALHSHAVDRRRIHIERFSPATAADPAETGPALPNESPQPAAERSGATQITIELSGQTKTGEHRAGTTILQMARQLGMTPPFSCEAGDCATCMARLTLGSAKMYVNNALTDDEVAEGWVLTCQAVPDPPAVHVIYDDEGL